VTYAKSGLFWSQCFLPSLVIRKAQAGAGKSSLGLQWYCKLFIDCQKILRLANNRLTLAVIGAGM
jgi:hypothetical protein